jgi:hypothetical protein
MATSGTSLNRRTDGQRGEASSDKHFSQADSKVVSISTRLAAFLAREFMLV